MQEGRSTRFVPRPLPLVLLGGALMLVPTVLYPGNWTDYAPGPGSVQAAWLGFATFVFAALAVGAVLVVLGIRALFLEWQKLPEPTFRGSLGRSLVDRRNRWVIVASALGYTLLFGTFVSLFGLDQGGPGILAGSYPSGVNVLCCGPVGDTPVFGLLVSSSFELVGYPMILLLTFGATLLFTLNMVATVTLLRSALRTSHLAGSTSLAAAGAVFVGCPACGTILAANVLAGTALAGFLVTWAVYQVPLALAAFPLSALALVWNARQLSSRAAGPVCRPRALRS